MSGKLLFANRKLGEMLGYDPSELVGKMIDEVTHPDDAQGNSNLFDLLTTGGAPFQIEKRFVRRDGSEIWADISVSAIRDSDGRPRSTVAVILDITERKRAEEQLRRSHDDLEH